MTVQTSSKATLAATAHSHFQGHEIQTYGSVVPMAIALGENARREGVANLNQLLADTITLRDLYKKHHWQVSGSLFHELHLLYDKHAGEQSELVDQSTARRTMIGTSSTSLAVATDIARPRSKRY